MSADVFSLTFILLPQLVIAAAAAVSANASKYVFFIVILPFVVRAVFVSMIVLYRGYLRIKWNESGISAFYCGICRSIM